MFDLKELWDKGVNIWMTPIRKEQREYNKSRILNKNDGTDWKREII